VKKRTQVNFRLDEQLLTAIQAHCHTADTTQTEFITYALKAALDKPSSPQLHDWQAALPSVLVRLSQTESCLADALAREQGLSDRIDALERQMGEFLRFQQERQSFGQSPSVPLSPENFPNLETLSHRILQELRLGRQAPGYRTAKKALSRFIAELTAD
jgi:hypothetical protein